MVLQYGANLCDVLLEKTAFHLTLRNRVTVVARRMCLHSVQYTVLPPPHLAAPEPKYSSTRPAIQFFACGGRKRGIRFARVDRSWVCLLKACRRPAGRPSGWLTGWLRCFAPALLLPAWTAGLAAWVAGWRTKGSGLPGYRSILAGGVVVLCNYRVQDTFLEFVFYCGPFFGTGGLMLFMVLCNTCGIQCPREAHRVAPNCCSIFSDFLAFIVLAAEVALAILILVTEDLITRSIDPTI